MTQPDLSRLFRPESIAIIGGGAWGRNIIRQCRRVGYEGQIWPVHPKAAELEGISCFTSVDDLPDAPDAAFVCVNRHATVSVVGALSRHGTGGAVCFASGFLEADAEDAEGAVLQQRLIEAAGDMPFLGPNTYGYVNYLEGALLWPDQHGGVRTDRGVALVTQSSNIAISISMQRRGLPLAYIVTAGNQAVLSLADIGKALLDDPRVTALGMHIEGISDLRGFEDMAAHAKALGKGIVALKVGRSDHAKQATVSHTASLAGADAGADALLRRLGIARVNSLPTLLETLKLLHVAGPLPSNKIATLSCSGGEACLIADSAAGHNVEFPALGQSQRKELREVLGPLVALANPLDYHTYIWHDEKAMADTFTAMMKGGQALTMLLIDFPRDDRCEVAEWLRAADAFVQAAGRTGGKAALLATVPETISEALAGRFMAAGLAPLMGIDEALAAAAAAAFIGVHVAPSQPLLLAEPSRVEAQLLTEVEAKKVLAVAGVQVPKSAGARTPQEAAEVAGTLAFPVVLKGMGMAHKTEEGAVVLGLADSAEVARAARGMTAPEGYLVEEMITCSVAELLVGVLRDPAHGFLLTLAAGGTLTEILEDKASLLLPASRAEIEAALMSLKVAPLLRGYRGQNGVCMPALLAAIEAVQSFCIEHASAVEEVEINPLLCTPERAVAVDALLRLRLDVRH